MNSGFGKLNLFDVVKGFLMAFFMAIVTGIYQAVQAGTIQFTWVFWQPIVYAGVGAALAYLIKQVFTNSGGDPLKTEK